MTTGKNGSSGRQLVARFLRFLLRESDEGERTPLPSRPTSRDDVPPAAWTQLEAACGSLALERLLVIPGTGKRTWIGGRLAMRTCVVAFGMKGVGQWTEDDDAGVVEVVPVEDLLAIDDRVILLHGRLVLIGKTRRLAIPYNTVARPQLRESILWLRRRIAGPAFATRSSFVWIGAKSVERPQGKLPYKWSYLLSCRDDLRIDPAESEMIAVGDVVEGVRYSTRPATGFALLGPRELVVAAEPTVRVYTPRYGVDMTVVPRCYIRDVGWSRGNMHIRLRVDGAEGLSILRPLDERLFVAMQRSFGDAVAWA